VTEFENELMDRLQAIADQKFGGHLTILKFTTNWRICFGSPYEEDLWNDIQKMPVGRSFAEAAQKAVNDPRPFGVEA
jgi:hypothetical protein